MNRIVYLVLLNLILQSCQTKQPGFTGTYKGAEDESFWTIELLNDSTFEYRTEGHIGNSITTGTLIFRGDTIYLEPTTGHGFSNRKAFINNNDSCLIELDYIIRDNQKISRDFCKERTENWTSNHWNLETMTPIKRKL